MSEPVRGWFEALPRVVGLVVELAGLPWELGLGLPTPVLCDTLDEVFGDSDAVVLLTAWSQYLELDWSKYAGLMSTPILLDGRHGLDPNRMAAAGYRYLSLA